MDDPLYSTDDAFFAAIGRLTLAWGLVDSCFETLILIIHVNLGGRSIEQEMPISLSRRIRYLRRCFRSLDAFKGEADKVLEVVDAVAVSSEMRHDVVHGMLMSDPTGPEGAKIARYLRDFGRPVRITNFTTDQIKAETAKIRDLGGKLLNITIAIGRLVDAIKQKRD